MKLRIEGNAIRIRVNREEVNQIAATGRVEGLTMFGAGPGGCLTYALRASDDVRMLSVIYRDGTLEVLLPREWVREWRETSRIGFEGSQLIDAADSLHILVEKDMACRHEAVVRPL